MDDDPPWLDHARRELGVRTFPDGRSNPRITAYHAGTNIAGYDDKAAWCSSFVQWCLGRCGIAGTGSALARSWLQWGEPLAAPRPGCIAVLTRGEPGSWRGHVGFYLRHDAEQVHLLGGNQQDSVCEWAYPLASVLGWRWPVADPAAHPASHRAAYPASHRRGHPAAHPADAASGGGAAEIRRARGDEAEALDALAFAAKARLGYAAADLERWRDELRIGAAPIAAGRAWVADLDGSPAAVLVCDERLPAWSLEHLWVAPAQQRRGLGRALLLHAVARAAAAGATVLRIDADPHAEAFYRRCGAHRVGTVAAPLAGEPQRVRPQLELPVAAGADTVPIAPVEPSAGPPRR